jgi:hypothetical protein
MGFYGHLWVFKGYYSLPWQTFNEKTLIFLEKVKNFGFKKTRVEIVGFADIINNRTVPFISIGHP